jgi:hypothetical protein
VPREDMMEMERNPTVELSLKSALKCDVIFRIAITKDR